MVLNFDNALKMGETVTIRVFDSTISDKGDRSDSYTDHTGIIARIDEFSGDLQYGPEGEISIGDAMGFFKTSDSSYLVEGNWVIDSASLRYKMMKVIPEKGMNGVILYYYVILKRI